MEKQFFILIGRSGCGKGTQAELLQKYLEGKGAEKVIHITTGGGFREFASKDTYISKLSRDRNEKGDLQPEFLAVWNVANIFINNLLGGETVILDGAPRREFEIDILHSAIKFMGYENLVAIYVDVSEGWAKERLLGRGRDDDKNEEGVKKRMDWFETEVLPVVDRYSRDPRYKYIHINGEQTVEGVHNDIVTKLENVAWVK